jgi:hypothetical protein
MEEPEDLGPRMRKHHCAVAIARNAIVGSADPGLCIMTSHHDTAIALDMKEEADDPGHQGMSMTMKTRKSRWGRHALPAGFAEHKYPKDSSYLTINRNTKDRKRPSHGYQTIFRL